MTAPGNDSARERFCAIADTHHGHVDEAHMGICHVLCYTFMENPQRAE